MSDPCLTPAQIERITGRKQPKRQLEWLRAEGYPAAMRADNTVSLGIAQYERGPQSAETSSIVRPTVQPIPRHAKGKKESAAAR